MEFSKIKVADRLQRVGQRTVLQVGRQRIQPSGILRLQLSEFSDRVTPPPRAATMVGWAPRSDHRRVSRARGTVTGLAFGIGHGFLANRLTRHDPTPNRYVTKQGRRCLWISRC